MDVKLDNTQEQQINPSGNEPQVQPEVQTAEQGQESTQPTQTEDLFKRVTEYIEEESPANKSEEQIDADIYKDGEFRQKIEAVQDPELKEYLIKLRKSGVSGVSAKMQEIAEIRKELQSLKADVQNKPFNIETYEWTDSDIDRLLRNQRFVSLASEKAGITQQEEDSEYIPDSVKKKLGEVEKLKAELDNMKKNSFKAQVHSVHEQLKSKYSDYDTNNIDTIYNSVLEGKMMPNPEDIYKALNHDKNVKRAYELGRQDERKGVSEKQAALSFEGTQQIPNSNIKPEDNENSKQFWRRIVSKNLESMNRK